MSVCKLPTVSSYGMSSSLSTPPFPLAYLMVLLASWFLLAWLSFSLSELSFSVNPSCYFNCCLHADVFCISTPCLSSRPPFLAVSDHGYLTGPSPAQPNVSETELSLLKARFPGSHQAHRGTHWVSSLSPPHAVMTAYSLFPLLLLNPGCLPTVPRSLVPYC